MNNLKIDNEVIRILELRELSRVICSTDKGYLTLKLRKAETQYWLYLDSVPLNKEDNSDLMTLLFPVKEREIPQVNTGITIEEKIINNPSQLKQLKKVIKESKKGGRPKGSKSKK